jgi:hypothetical protein
MSLFGTKQLIRDKNKRKGNAKAFLQSIGAIAQLSQQYHQAVGDLGREALPLLLPIV